MLLFAVDVPVVHAGADGPRYADFHFSHASILIHNIFIGACARKIVFISRQHRSKKWIWKKNESEKRLKVEKRETSWNLKILMLIESQIDVSWENRPEITKSELTLNFC